VKHAEGNVKTGTFVITATIFTWNMTKDGYFELSVMSSNQPPKQTIKQDLANQAADTPGSLFYKPIDSIKVSLGNHEIQRSLSFIQSHCRLQM
jgi:hypothetical protein